MLWATPGVLVKVGPNRDSLVKISSGHVFRRNSHFLRRRVPVIPGQASALQPSWDAKQQQNRATPSSRAAVVAAAAKPCPAARPYPAASSCPAASSGPATASQQTPQAATQKESGPSRKKRVKTSTHYLVTLVVMILHLRVNLICMHVSKNQSCFLLKRGM